MKLGLISDYFSREEKKEIVEAIRVAEKDTSGEIRVYFERSTKNMTVMDRAYRAFEKLDMHQTAEGNGVLFYVAFGDHECAIIGGAGIHAKVGDAFWEEELEILQTHFRRDEYVPGLQRAIRLAGERLAEFFPYGREDVNELDDEIYFDED